MAVGRSRDRHGNPMTMTLKGKVEPFYQGVEDKPESGEAGEA